MEVKIMDKPKYDWLKIWEIQRKFLSESVIFSLIQYPVHLSNDNETISWTLFGILFVVSLSTLLLARGHQKRFFSSFCWCAIPIMILSKILLNIPITEIILLFLFSLWRLSVFTKEGYDDEYEEFLEHRLLSTTLIFISMYFICYTIQIQSRNIMVFFLFIQLFIYSYGTFIKRFLQSKNELTNKKSMFSFGVALVIIPLGISAIAIFMASIIKQGLALVLNKVFLYIAYLLSPVINGLIDFFNTRGSRLDHLLKDQEKKKVPLPVIDHHPNTLINIHQEHTFIFMFVVLFIIAFWVYWRLKKTHFSTEIKMDQSIYNKFTQHKILEKQGKEWDSTNYYSKNRQQIRKYVFDLERYAEKMKSKRLGFESVRDWLTRLNIDASTKWVLIYEDVRYGMKEVSGQELKQFVEELERIKRELKEINKKKMSY